MKLFSTPLKGNLQVYRLIVGLGLATSRVFPELDLKKNHAGDFLLIVLLLGNNHIILLVSLS